MVSTRSGRSTNSIASGPTTRSRAKRDANAEDTYADVGQPEVSSPSPQLQSKVFADSPAPFEAFGSPLPPPGGLDTVTQKDMSEIPLATERVVKTVGKGVPSTPLPRATPAVPAMTPSAKEVKQIASIPLPDDLSGGETEPYVTSEDEPAGPTSPPKTQTATASPVVAARQRVSRGAGPLFGLFAFSSVLATVALALILAPCADEVLYAKLQAPAYERICRSLVQLEDDVRTRAGDLSWRLRAEAAGHLWPLYAKLPPAAQEALEQAWAPLTEAHSAAWGCLKSFTERANGQTADLQLRVKDAYLGSVRQLFTLLTPYAEKALPHIYKVFPHLASLVGGTAAGVPEGHSVVGDMPSALGLADLLSVLDESPAVQQYAQELWEASKRQVASKQKAAAWVIACQQGAECAAARDALMSAAASFLQIDGASFGSETSAGQLQNDTVTFLRAYPSGLVLVSEAGRMHSNCVAVINAAISESGHLQRDGAPVPTKDALYVFLVEDALADGEVVQDAEKEAGVKERLCDKIASVEPQTSSAAATVLSFRRRLDAVLPARKVVAAQ